MIIPIAPRRDWILDGRTVDIALGKEVLNNLNACKASGGFTRRASWVPQRPKQAFGRGACT